MALLPQCVVITRVNSYAGHYSIIGVISINVKNDATLSVRLRGGSLPAALVQGVADGMKEMEKWLRLQVDWNKCKIIINDLPIEDNGGDDDDDDDEEG